MERVMAVLLTVLLAAAQMANVFASPITAPAFLWSPKNYRSSPHAVKEIVNYQTLSPKDLAKHVLLEGGWSNLMCAGKSLHQNVDIALVFVGRKLQSSDISKTKHQDSDLLDLLKLSFTTSNLSMSFPYVAISDEKDALENSLISGFVENCGQGLGVNQIAYLESCSVDDEDLKQCLDLSTFQDFVVAKTERRASGQTDLVVLSGEGSELQGHSQSEGKILSEVVKFLEQSGATYTILYASDPHKSFQYRYRAMSRFLAETTTGNSSGNPTCDGLCQLKSSLLEGIFVGIVLLIILISGLCCMMGIDTPTRFEAPQES